MNSSAKVLAPGGEAALEDDRTWLKARPMAEIVMMPGVHVGDREVVLRVVDEVAEPGLGADHLGGDEHQDRVRPRPAGCR